LNNGEELHRALDEQSKQVLFNSVCVIDLTASGTDFQFDLRADARHVLRPTELIVRYPEIYWIFVVNRLPDWESAEDQLQRVCISPDLLLLHFVEVTRLMDLVLRLREHASGYRTIFDPTGLRFLVLISSNATHTKQDTISPLGLPSLNQLSQSGPLTYGISLEDELGYALLNGYFLYKQGLSTFVIATLAEYRRSVTYAQHLSNNHDTSLPFAWHAIEDVELCFADTLDVEPFRNLLMPAEGENDFEMLAARAANNPLLKLAKTRLILTTVRLERNQLKQTSGQNCETLSKPYRGLYDDTLNLLFSETSTPAGDRAFGRLHFRVLMTFQCFFFLLVAKQRLGRLLKSTQSKCSSLIRRFLHFGPLNSKQDDLPPKVHVPEHSAPGSNQEVAAHLLKRCKSSSHTLTAPEDAIQCSVMANVAYRLLNKRTQHTALDALSLQNLMEAEAECMFIGISNSLDITPRVTSIEREVALVTSVNAADDYAKFWKRHQQRCSALLKIFGDLRHVYQHYDQREQESDLLCAFRSWQRLAFINGNKEWINNCFTTRWLKGLGRCALSVLWGYLNFLVGSGRNLLFASALWIVLFAGAYDVLVTATIAEHRRLQEWQSIHLKAAKIQRFQLLAPTVSSYIRRNAPVPRRWPSPCTDFRFRVAERGRRSSKDH
jgi:hypothetical protein